MSLAIITASMVARSGATLMARLTGNQGALVQQADFTAITWQIVDLTSGAVVTNGSGTFTVASVIFNTLQQSDVRWTLAGGDTAKVPGPDGNYGYNFLATIPASLFAAVTIGAGLNPATAHVFQVDVRFTPASGEVFTVSWQLLVYPVYLA